MHEIDIPSWAVDRVIKQRDDRWTGLSFAQNHCAPTVCIQVPMFDVSAAMEKATEHTAPQRRPCGRRRIRAVS